jgi:hypothetical protein
LQATVVCYLAKMLGSSSSSIRLVTAENPLLDQEPCWLIFLCVCATVSSISLVYLYTLGQKLHKMFAMRSPAFS